MSFDANIGRSTPIIKAAANMNNDGGSGGNTGYMMRGKRKKDDELHGSLFDNGGSFDSFEFQSKPKDFENINQNSWIDNLLNKIKK